MGAIGLIWLILKTYIYIYVIYMCIYILIKLNILLFIDTSYKTDICNTYM